MRVRVRVRVTVGVSVRVGVKVGIGIGARVGAGLRFESLAELKRAKQPVAEGGTVQLAFSWKEASPNPDLDLDLSVSLSLSLTSTCRHGCRRASVQAQLAFTF